MSSLLSFDTATEHMSIALDVDGNVRVQEAAGGASASTTLIPAIQGLLASAGMQVRDLDAIAFGRGPGAFTGLRTACAVAQGLAFGASKPVLSLDTLMAVAEDARVRARVSDVWVVMDARMSEIYAARYRLVPGDNPGGDASLFKDERHGAAVSAWSTVSPPALYPLDVMNALFACEAAEPVTIAGTAVEAFGDALRAGAALRVAGALPRAAALAVIARQQWAAGAATDAALALPLYVRDKVALTTVEREIAKAAKSAAAATA